jgi:hypothetical protein
MSTDFHSIALTAEQQLQLAMLAQQAGKSPNDLIDQMLAQCEATAPTNGTSNGRTLYDALAADGSIGMIKGGPTDLSTNPKYMEGFGRSGK